MEINLAEKELKDLISSSVKELLAEKKEPETKEPEKKEDKATSEENIKKMIEDALSKVTTDSKMQFPSVVKEQGDKKRSFGEMLLGVKTKDPYLTKKYDLQFKKDEKVLVEGVPNLGGFIVPPEYSTQLIDLVTSFSIIRPLCSVVPMSSNVLYMPVVDGGGSAYWIDENAQKTPSDLNFKQLTLNAYKLCMLIKVSDELLADSNPAVDSVLMSMFAKVIANQEDLAFLQGAGVPGDPITGIINSGIVNIPSGAALDFDDCFDAIGSVLTNNGKDIDTVFAPRDHTTLRKLKDAAGQYLWAPAAGSSPETIDGRPVYYDGNIPTNLGAGLNESYAIVGDFNSAYIGDRSDITITVGLDNNDFSYDRTSFRAVKRVGFAVADATKFAQISGILP